MPSLREELLFSIYGGLIYLLNPYELGWGNQQYTTNSIYKAIDRLEKDGLLRKRRKEKNTFLHLTEKGKKAVRKHRKSGGHASRKWDGKWRVVIFDVPEKRAQARKYLRNYLKSLGFGMVQRSIWITPYDLGRLVDHFSTKMKITDCIYHLTVTQFRGLKDVKLAQTFWPIETIDSEYQNLINKYSSRFNQLQRKKDNTDPSSSNPGKQFLNSLLWDYQSIAARDPQLPSQLLLPGWSQKKALEFINRVKNTIKIVN